MVYCPLQNTHPNTFKGRIPELLPCKNSHGDFYSNTLEGILLINAATIKTACPHNCFGTFIEIIMLLVSSRRCLFFVLQVFTNSCTRAQIFITCTYILNSITECRDWVNTIWSLLDNLVESMYCSLLSANGTIQVWSRMVKVPMFEPNDHKQILWTCWAKQELCWTSIDIYLFACNKSMTPKLRCEKNIYNYLNDVYNIKKLTWLSFTLFFIVFCVVVFDIMLFCDSFSCKTYKKEVVI